MKSSPEPFICPLCERECPYETRSKHHTLPRSEGGRETTAICADCHRQLHVLFGLKDLARDYDTIEKLRQAPEMQRWIKWVSGRSRVHKPSKEKRGRG